MADPFVAEIRMVASNFAPRGWAFCNGQLLPLSQNTALFSLLGTTYGGDGKSNFALPDLQARFPMHHGQGPGLSARDLGESAGSALVELMQQQMPAHTHTLRAGAGATQTSPAGNVLGQSSSAKIYGPAVSMVPMADAAVQPAGGAAQHDNRQPFLAVTFIIAMQGVYPPRG
jgi:microcystin-dependent protein